MNCLIAYDLDSFRTLIVWLCKSFISILKFFEKIITKLIFLLPHAGVSPFQVYPVLGPHLYSFCGKLFGTNEYPGVHPTSQTRCSFLSEQFNTFPNDRTRTGHAD